MKNILSLKTFTLTITGACLLPLIWVSGCAYKGIRQGSEIKEQQVAEIVDGKTTKDEVYLTCGEPKKVLENGRVFIYNWVRGSKWHILGLGRGTAYGHSLIMTFDEKNVVKGHRVTRGDVEGSAVVND